MTCGVRNTGHTARVDASVAERETTEFRPWTVRREVVAGQWLFAVPGPTLAAAVPSLVALAVLFEVLDAWWTAVRHLAKEGT